MLRILLSASCFALFFALAASAAPAGARTGLVNGSFEPLAGVSSAPGADAAAIPGWQASPRGVAWLPAGSGGFVAPNGDFVVRLAADAQGAGRITQTFVTWPGERYDVAFWLGGRAVDARAGRATLRVDVAGTSRTVAFENASDEVLWQAHVLTFTATGKTTTLSFCGSHASRAAALLDGVAVRPAATAACGPRTQAGTDATN